MFLTNISSSFFVFHCNVSAAAQRKYGNKVSLSVTTSGGWKEALYYNYIVGDMICDMVLMLPPFLSFLRSFFRACVITLNEI